MRSAALGLVVLAAWACDGRREAPAAGGHRAAAVKQTQAKGPVADPSGFCEKAYPASGATARAFVWPALRPLPGASAAEAPATGGRWTWVNLWATWCVPCVAELGLLARWATALEKDGAGIRLELVSIDAETDADALKAKIAAGLPGAVRWLRAEADFEQILDTLGVSRGTAIPIHALIDPTGKVRCVRVGAIHAPDYAAVRTILAGG